MKFSILAAAVAFAGLSQAAPAANVHDIIQARQVTANELRMGSHRLSARQSQQSAGSDSWVVGKYAQCNPAFPGEYNATPEMCQSSHGFMLGFKCESENA
jgi:hypothetical protein